MNYISDHKIRNTHSHHLPEQAMVDFDLDKLINNMYLQWQQVTPGTTAESRTAYLEKTRYKSYFVRQCGKNIRMTPERGENEP